MADAKSNKNIFSKIFKIIYYLITILVCLIVFFLLYYIISSQLHADDEEYKSFVSVYTIVSPSMTPVIKVYDVVVNIRVDDPTSIQPGDIITYKSAAANSEGMTITHRVIEVSQLPDGTYEYMTQGDNNKEPDSLYVTFDKVIGKEILIIPQIGRLQFLIANQKGWLIFLLIPVLIYLIKEVIKLIDLFNLRKKVDRVVGTTEDNFIEKKRQEKIANEERKERIRKELQAANRKISAYEKSAKEPDGFLERYSETIVTVKENKYAKIIKPTKEMPTVEEQEQIVKEKNSIESNKTIAPQNEKIEILDTDELSTKIKEYDDKLTELNKILYKVENPKNKMEAQTSTAITTTSHSNSYDNYLQGRIKVTNIIPAKEYTPNNKIKISFTELDNNSKPETKEIISRPITEDIQESRNPKNRNEIKTSNTNLNLNPNNIKKVNRPNKKKNNVNNNNIRNQQGPSQNNQSPKNQPTPPKQQLNLNPNQVKKVNRPNRKKKRPPLIVIEKQSKSR